jgi:drug/metabolite transporter (DMT)-like permease
MRARHLVAFCLVAGIWGTTWLAIKFVVREMPPLSAAGVRFGLAALLLAGYARSTGRSLSWRRWQGSERRLVLLLSIFMIAVPYGLVFYGELTVSSALAAILFSCHPAFVLLFDSVHVRRNLLTGPRLAGLILAFVGILIIFRPRLASPHAELGGVVAILGAAVSSALATVLAKHHGHHLDPVAGTTWQMAGAAVWLLGAGALVERPGWSGYSLGGVAALLYLVAFGSCVTFVLYYELLKHMAPVQLSTLSFIIPMIATAVGWAVLNERLGVHSLLGAAAVLAGVALLHRREREAGLVGAGD